MCIFIFLAHRTAKTNITPCWYRERRLYSAKIVQQSALHGSLQTLHQKDCPRCRSRAYQPCWHVTPTRAVLQPRLLRVIAYGFPLLACNGGAAINQYSAHRRIYWCSTYTLAVTFDLDPWPRISIPCKMTYACVRIRRSVGSKGRAEANKLADRRIQPRAIPDQLG